MGHVTLPTQTDRKRICTLCEKCCLWGKSVTNMAASRNVGVACNIWCTDTRF